MADAKDTVLSVYEFPRMDRGMDTEAPARSLTPEAGGALYRNLWNLTAHGGALATWTGIYDGMPSPTVDGNGGYYGNATAGALNGQVPMYIFTDFPQTYANSSSTTQPDYGKFICVLVTSREIFIYSPQDSTWYNATPTYSTGTAGTGGVPSTTVTGVGTAWSARKIAKGQLIQFNGAGTWYSIEAVNSDTSLKLTANATVAAGSTYIIRRCFGGRSYSHGDNLLYATVFNGDLYVGGRTLAGASHGPAIIRVKSVYDNVFVTEYLLAGFDLTGSMTAAGSVMAGLWDIKGLKILPDGRVLAAASIVPTGHTGIVGNRLIYSSNLDQKIWNASPGGFIDCVGIEGEITALGELRAGTYTVHFHRGIQLASFTAQYDPPLAVTTSSASVGAAAPRSLVLHKGIELYVGADGLPHAFNGSEDEVMANDTVLFGHMDEAAGGGAFPNFPYSRVASFVGPNVYGFIDKRRNLYRLFFNDNNFEQVTTAPATTADYELRCLCWCIDLEDGQVYQEEYQSNQITACGWPVMGLALSSYDPSAGGTRCDYGIFAIGTQSAELTDASSSQRMLSLCSVHSGPIWDSTYTGFDPKVNAALGMRRFPNGIAGGRVGFETDDLDFGKPGVDKTIDHILFWVSRDNTDGPNVMTLSVEISPDSGKTWYASTPSMQDGFDIARAAFYSPRASEKWRVRVYDQQNPLDLDALWMHFHRMRIYYQEGGEIEPVRADLATA